MPIVAVMPAVVALMTMAPSVMAPMDFLDASSMAGPHGGRSGLAGDWCKWFSSGNQIQREESQKDN
jgi:hypothetical protein